MDARSVTWLEAVLDWAAAAVLAAAVALAAIRLGSPPAIAGAAGLAILAGGRLALRGVGPAPAQFVLGDFPLEPLPAAEPIDELVLTEADRLDRAGNEGSAEELLLDDVLAEIEDSSRVVRLFDRTSMPTPAELRARIDRHLDRSPPPAHDASQALHDALSELRRTLR